MKEILLLKVLKLTKVEKKENFVTYDFRQPRGGSFTQGWAYFYHDHVVEFVYLFIKYFYLIFAHYGFIKNIVGTKIVVFVIWEDTTVWGFGRRHIKTYFKFTVNDELKDKFIEDKVIAMFKNNSEIYQLLPANRKNDDNLVLLAGIRIHILTNVKDH